MAGGEMTTVGRQYSNRISGLVYIDALGDLEDEPPADPEWAALARKIPPDWRPAPVCAPQDNMTFAAFRLSQACRHGVVRSDFKPPKDDSERATVDAFVARGRVLVNRWIDKVKSHVPDVRVVDIPGGGHDIFLARESDVLREIHTFVASLAR